MRFSQILILLAACTVSGCKPSRHSQLEGKWNVREFGDHSMEFFSDGTYVGGQPGEKRGGKWSIVNGDRLKLSNVVNGTETASLFAMSTDDKAITLTGEQGAVITLTRP